MKVIVTGGAGFIGSHLVEALVSDGHTVTVIDDFSSGERRNLAAVVKKIRIYVADIAKDRKLKQIFRGTDWVFHLAARADIVPSITMPLLYHNINVTGTINILEAARLGRVKRFIYAASSSCYGVPERYPTDEFALIAPMYPYALTKYLGELAVLHWGQVYKLPILSLRLFNVYGPRSRTSGLYGAVFGTFLAQKRAGKPLTVVGNGSQVRDFTYVTDVARAFVKAAGSDISNEVINIGTGKPQSINSLVKLIGGHATHIPKRPGEPDKTQADIRKAKRLLHWKPTTSFEDGVKLMLAHIDNWKDAPVWTPKKIEKATKDWFAYLT